MALDVSRVLSTDSKGHVSLHDVELLTAPLSQRSFDLVGLLDELGSSLAGDQSTLQMQLWRLATFVVECIDTAVGPPPIATTPSVCLCRMLDLAAEVFVNIRDARWISLLEGCPAISMNFPVLLCAFVMAQGKEDHAAAANAVPSCRLVSCIERFVDVALLLQPLARYPTLPFLDFVRRVVPQYPNCLRLHVVAGAIDDTTIAEFLPPLSASPCSCQPAGAKPNQKNKKQQSAERSAEKKSMPEQKVRSGPVALTSWMLCAMAESLRDEKHRAMLLAHLDTDAKFMSVVGSDSVCAATVMNIYGDVLSKKLTPRALTFCFDESTIEFVIELVARSPTSQQHVGWIAQLSSCCSTMLSSPSSVDAKQPQRSPALEDEKFARCFRRCVELSLDSAVVNSCANGLLVVAAALVRSCFPSPADCAVGVPCGMADDVVANCKSEMLCMVARLHRFCAPTTLLVAAQVALDALAQECVRRCRNCTADSSSRDETAMASIAALARFAAEQAQLRLTTAPPPIGHTRSKKGKRHPLPSLVEGKSSASTTLPCSAAVEDVARFATALLRTGYSQAAAGHGGGTHDGETASGWGQLLSAIASYARMAGDFAPSSVAQFIRTAVRVGVLRGGHDLFCSSEREALVASLIRHRRSDIIVVLSAIARACPDLFPISVICECIATLDGPQRRLAFPGTLTTLAHIVIGHREAFSSAVRTLLAEGDSSQPSCTDGGSHSLNFLLATSLDELVADLASQQETSAHHQCSNLAASLDLVRTAVQRTVEATREAHQASSEAGRESKLQLLQEQWRVKEEHRLEQQHADQLRRVQRLANERKQQRLYEADMDRKYQVEEARALEVANRKDRYSSRIREAAVSAAANERHRQAQLAASLRASKNREDRVAEIRRLLDEVSVPASQTYSVLLRFRRAPQITVQSVLEFVVTGEVTYDDAEREEPDTISASTGAAVPRHGGGDVSSSAKSSGGTETATSWFGDEMEDDFWESCRAEAFKFSALQGYPVKDSITAASQENPSPSVPPVKALHDRLAILLDLFDYSPSCERSDGVDGLAPPIPHTAVRCAIPLDELRSLNWDDVDHAIFVAEQKKLVTLHHHLLELTRLGYRYHVTKWNPRRSFSSICRAKAEQLSCMLEERRTAQSAIPENGSANEEEVKEDDEYALLDDFEFD